MKKLVSILLIMFLLVILVVAGTALAGYLYLKSDGFKSRVEQAISQYTTTPASIDSLGIGITGITLQGLVVPNEAPLTDTFLETGTFELKLKWLSLLEEIPSIDAIHIGGPSLALHQAASGGMQLPIQETGADSSAASGLDLVLRELVIQDGSFQAFDPEGQPLIQIQGLNLGGDVKRLSGDWRLESNLSTRSIVAGPYITVSDVGSPLTMAGKIIELPDVQGSFYGGSLNGQTKLDLNSDDPIFVFKLNAVGSDMDQMLQSFGKEPGFMQGPLDFSLSGQGKASMPKNLAGQGNFKIAPAKMPKLQVAKMLGGILGVKLIQDGTFDEVSGTFTIRDQQVDFSELDVISENVSVQLSGTVGFDAQLDLQGKVILEPGATDVFSKLFGQTADRIRSEMRELPLTITGPSSQPKVEVDTIQVGLDTGKNLLNRFLFNQEETDQTESAESDSISDDPVEAVDSLIKGFLGN
ncbi:MAG: AsmA-like C-terminal region-containing protein [Verrucomicrobiota bacterium]